MPRHPIAPESDPGDDSRPNEADLLLDEAALLPDTEGEPLDHPALDSIDPDLLSASVRSALADLGGPRGLAAVRVVEAMGDPDLFDALADALLDQPDLPVDLLYRALQVLEGSGRIEARPELFALREELIEALDGDDATLDGLIEQIEEEPEDVWIPLQGLAEIEPDVRAEIVAELGAGGPIGPGTAELLRLLCYAHDPALRRSALDALEAASPAEPGGPAGDDPVSRAWLDLAAHHPDPNVSSRASRRLGNRGPSGPGLPAARPAPRIVASLVTGLDGRGRGQVALVADDPGAGLRVCSAFGCDVMAGVVAVVGRIAPIADPEPGAALLAELRGHPGRDEVEGAPELALGLLAGALLLCGPGTTPALRFWLERTAGPALGPRPFSGLALDPAERSPLLDPPPFEEMASRVDDVLDACPGWIDDSDLTFELAEELLLRWGGAPPDPRRDAGAYRFLFEHRLRDQLELYRRMLFWMGWLWQAAGAPELARSSLALAEQLSDPQHVVPSHPFASALATRSLLAAQNGLRLGLDLRDPAARARMEAGDLPG
ncbi:hypothetical protein [Tautonia sociabilis]|uniref:Uncharacterized protein n=1 Tax=Tautonia sociabilis TaxID=2080755 RepID=A0A432MKF6_9BACT|nr:hypothetical protein [Tautonia sociabilis]RUL87750.1 hypothetical protein TsocGM_10320 [Tautonia sociabilis]